MGLFRRKKKENPTMPKGYKYTKPKKPKKVKASSNKQYVGTSDLYTVVRIIEEWVHTRHFIILEKELEIVRTGDYTHRFSFKGLSDYDVSLWRNTIGNRASGGIGPWNPWPPRTEYFLVSHHELMVALHNFLASNDRLYSLTFSECKSSGKFSKTELMEIYPQWVEEMREAQRRQEIEKQEIMEQEELKEIQREEEYQRRLEYEVKKKITMHNLDKKLNPPPKEEKTKPETPKPKYDESKRLANIGIILDANGDSTEYPLKFDIDKIIPKHIAVIGAIGNGKSITAYDIAEEVLSYNIPVLVLDPTNKWTGFLKECTLPEFIRKYDEFEMKNPKSYSGRVFVPGTNFSTPLNTNLLAKPNTDDSGKLHTLAEETAKLIEDFCGKLGKNDSVRVEDKIIKSWIPEQGDKDSQEEIPLNYEKLRNEFASSEDAHKRLRRLEQATFLFDGPRLDDISKIWKDGEISVIATKGLDPKIQSHVAYYILRELLNYFNPLDPVDTKSEKIRLLLVIEESHEFREKKEVQSAIELIARTLRKQGLGVLFVTQRFVDLEEAQAFVNTKIYMRTFHPADVDRASIDLGTKAREILGGLETGSGVFASADFGNPVHVKFRPCYHYPDIIDLQGL